MATVEELAGRQFSRILAMRDESIEIRRGTDTLNPQTVRLERAEARALTLDNQTSEQVVADVVILGALTWILPPAIDSTTPAAISLKLLL
jgi:hypothetical protein